MTSKVLQHKQVCLEMYSFKDFRLAEVTITKQQNTYVATLGFYVCMVVLFPHPPKVSVSCRHPCQGRDPPWSCLQHQGTSLASWPSLHQHLTLMQADVHQSQSKTSQHPHLWNTLIAWSSRQFFLQCLPGVFILGQTILTTRGKAAWWGRTHVKIWLSFFTITVNCLQRSIGF